MSIEIVHVGPAEADGRWPRTLQKSQSGLDLRPLVNSRAVQGADAGGGAGEALSAAASAALFHVAEKSKSLVLARLDVLDALIDVGFRHEDAGIAGGAQGHDLANGHGDVGFAAAGHIAPAALSR